MAVVVLTFGGALSGVAAADGEWPLLTLRHNRGVNDCPDVMAKLVEIQRRHPGCCDEVWLETGDRTNVAETRRRARQCASFRALYEEAGIGFGFQQGCTFGHDLTREALVARLDGEALHDPLRAEWRRFSADSLACYGAAAARAADEVLPDCRVAYQSVRGTVLDNGPDFRPLLKALTGTRRTCTGIRPGDGVYTEAMPRQFVEKALLVAREAERCRTYGGLVGTVCYEQETYSRHVLHKSPDAIVTESLLAMASGCDTLSHYWFMQEGPEPLEDFERFRRDCPNAVAHDDGKWAQVPEPDPFARCSVRKAWLDALDEVTDGAFPVRVNLNHPLRILPRVDGEGRLVQLSVLNCSIGDTGPFEIELRQGGAKRTEKVANLAGWKMMTLFLQ